MGLFQSRPVQGPFGVAQPPPTNYVRILTTILGAIFLFGVAIVVYNYFRRRSGLAPITLSSGTASGDKLPTPVVGKTKTVISATELPTATGGDYGMQYWMYIGDWDYKFGQEKPVVKRVDSTNEGIKNPDITLHPTDNSLQVRVGIYPSEETTTAGTEAGASANGDSFVCTVENVPLQAWFSVSVTVFQRNLDIYINGRLVKSCVLPGVPKPVFGDVIIGDAGGFSGSVCNLRTYANMLTAEDAKSFFAAGTRCAPPSEAGKQPVDKDSFFFTLFGYTFRFAKIDKLGKELSSYTF